MMRIEEGGEKVEEEEEVCWEFGEAI